jgi:hypothetical protein
MIKSVSSLLKGGILSEKYTMCALLLMKGRLKEGCLAVLAEIYGDDTSPDLKEDVNPIC